MEFLSLYIIGKINENTSCIAAPTIGTVEGIGCTYFMIMLQLPLTPESNDDIARAKSQKEDGENCSALLFRFHYIIFLGTSQRTPSIFGSALPGNAGAL